MIKNVSLATAALVLSLHLPGCTSGGGSEGAGGGADDDYGDRPENATVTLSLEGIFDESADTWLYTGFIPTPDWTDCMPAETFYGRYDIGSLNVNSPAFVSRAAGEISRNDPAEIFAFSETFGERPYLQATLEVVEWSDSRIELSVRDTQLCSDKAAMDAPMVDCVAGPDGSYVAEAYDTFDEVGEFNIVGEPDWIDDGTGDLLCTGSYLAAESMPVTGEE
jgi:hypothetical protein